MARKEGASGGLRNGCSGWTAAHGSPRTHRRAVGKSRTALAQRPRCSRTAARDQCGMGTGTQNVPRRRKAAGLATSHKRRGPLARRRPRSHLRLHARSEEHTSELQSLAYLVCRLLLEKKKHYRTDVPTPSTVFGPSSIATHFADTHRSSSPSTAVSMLTTFTQLLL